jgi:deoxyribodipyrimidine photolyase
LTVLWGKPEDLLVSVIQETSARGVYFQSETTYEELQVEKKLVEAISVQFPHIVVKKFQGQTLLHPQGESRVALVVHKLRMLNRCSL